MSSTKHDFTHPDNEYFTVGDSVRIRTFTDYADVNHNDYGLQVLLNVRETKRRFPDQYGHLRLPKKMTLYRRIEIPKSKEDTKKEDCDPLCHTLTIPGKSSVKRFPPLTLMSELIVAASVCNGEINKDRRPSTIRIRPEHEYLYDSDESRRIMEYFGFEHRGII